MEINVSSRLIQAREVSHLTREELAKKLGVEIRLVEQWESGQSIPNADNLLALSEIYGKSIDEILYQGVEAPEYDEEKAVHKDVLSSAQREKKNKQKKGKTIPPLVLWGFPILCVIAFWTIGIFAGSYHPAWMLLLLIPVYYLVVFGVGALIRNLDEAVDEYKEEVQNENTDKRN